MKIKHSYFDYGGEIEVCGTCQIGGEPARLAIRRIDDQYELYARFYRFTEPDAEEVILRDSLEKVVQTANTLMWREFGSTWEGDAVVPDD
jgi:hypothetical protein